MLKVSLTIFKVIILSIISVNSWSQFNIYILISAKWHKLEFNSVPKLFFEQFLADLKNPSPNSVKITHHWRAPILTSSATKISYKLYDFQRLLDVLLISDFHLESDISWRGNVRLIEDEEEEIDMLRKIELARQRAGRKANSRPTCRSSIVIKEVLGRGSRELEIMWWPDLYAVSTALGKMCLRFYVNKVHFPGA